MTLAAICREYRLSMEDVKRLKLWEINMLAAQIEADQRKQQDDQRQSGPRR